MNCYESLVEWRFVLAQHQLIGNDDNLIFEIRLSNARVNQYIHIVVLIIDHIVCEKGNTICDDGSSGEDKSMSDFVTKSYHCLLFHFCS